MKRKSTSRCQPVKCNGRECLTKLRFKPDVSCECRIIGIVLFIWLDDFWIDDMSGDVEKSVCLKGKGSSRMRNRLTV